MFSTEARANKQGQWGKWGGSRSFAFRLIAILLQWIQQGPFCTLPGSNYEICPLDLVILLAWQRSPCIRSSMEYVLLKDLDNLVFHWIEINDELVQMWIHQMIARRQCSSLILSKSFVQISKLVALVSSCWQNRGRKKHWRAICCVQSPSC